MIEHTRPRPVDVQTLIVRGLIFDVKPRPSMAAMLKAIDCLATRPGQRLTTRQLRAGSLDRAAARLSAGGRPASAIHNALSHVRQLWEYAWRLGLAEDAPPDELPPQAGRSSATHRPTDPTREQIADRAAVLHA